MNEQDRARLYFLREQIKDRVLGEELRLVVSTVMEICQILSGMEKHQ